MTLKGTKLLVGIKETNYWYINWFNNEVIVFFYFVGGTQNVRKSVARFCHQVAPWVPDVFCNFYFAKNHKIAYNSATTEAG